MEIENVFKIYKVKDIVHIDYVNEYEPIDKNFIWGAESNEFCYYKKWENYVKVKVGKHWNESLEIIHIIDGELEITTSNGNIILKKDEVAIIGGNSIHGTEAITNNLKHECLQIKFDFLVKYFDCEYLSLKIFKVNDIEKLLSYYINIANNISKKDVISQIKVKANVLLLVAAIMEDKNYKMANVEKNKLNDVISEVIHYINCNFKENITLNSIADYFGYSSQNFAMFFKKNTGTTVYSYLNDIRLENAVYELLNSNKNIIDIALESGFPNEMAFIKRFKNKYSSTPKAYKKQYLSN